MKMISRGQSFLTTCAFAIAVAMGSSQHLNAATVTTIEALGPVGGVAGGAYQKPAGLLTAGGLDQLMTGTDNLLGTSLRGDRNQGQTFTISAEDYPLGVSVDAFVMNIRARSDVNNPTFGVQLIPVASANPASLTATGPALVSNPITGAGSLQYPSQSQLSVTGGGSGTVDYGTLIFKFDSSVILAPGSYAWQFFTSQSGSNSNQNPAWWSTADGNPYAGGGLYVNSGAAGLAPLPVSGTSYQDVAFGLIGVSVPEPGSFVTLGIGVVGLAAVRRRRRS
jgi:hypothetical protein